MNKVINLTPDYLNAIDKLDKKVIEHRMSGGPKRTKITITNHDTGEKLGEFENKVLISGSILNGIRAWGIEPPVVLPNYNTEMNLDNSFEQGVTPKNNPIICLFCVGDTGCGATAKDVFTAKFTDRIDPEHIFPFKYVDVDDDLNTDLRNVYFGRKTLLNEDKIAYYFKAFDTVPQMHLNYTDGTQINEEMYNIETSQSAECYVETKLSITRTDFRDYFEQVIGWDNARISSLSLCYAWYDDTIDDYRWYQDIYPYTKLNFSVEFLTDLTKAIDFNYQIFY